MIRSIKEVKECPDCGSDNIYYSENRSQMICRDCGLIFEPLAPQDEERYEKVAGLSKGAKQTSVKKKAKVKKKPAKKVKAAKKSRKGRK